MVTLVMKQSRERQLSGRSVDKQRKTSTNHQKDIKNMLDSIWALDFMEFPYIPPQYRRGFTGTLEYRSSSGGTWKNNKS